MKRSVRLTLAIIGWLGVACAAWAQPGSAGQFAPAPAASSTLSEGQLDQLTAPIALYPDPLVGQILMAATYPLEIVEAHRWLQEPDNDALKGDALAAALQEQSWDLSVKSLVPFPQILQMMDGDLDWTEQIGSAFLAQQDAVMDSIQRLRQRAAGAGSLRSTPQEAVSTQPQDIDIEPTSADEVYVPCYDPSTIYGPWPWPDDPPADLLPPGTGACSSAWIGFPILRPFWGWNRWDWRHHRLNLVAGRAPVTAGPWEHDPAHRHGVPYRNEALGARYQAESEDARRDVRGFPTAPAGTRVESERGTAIVPPEARPRTVAPSARPALPAFESFGAGSQVRRESERGAESRSTPVQRPTPVQRTAPVPRTAPVQRSAPSAHGGAPLPR